MKKEWGFTSEIWRGETYSVHLIEVVRGGFCSCHRHKHKANVFYVIDGAMQIVTWHGVEPDITTINAGATAVVPAGVWHRFRARSGPVQALEIYQSEACTEDDIERRDVGGIEA